MVDHIDTLSLVLQKAKALGADAADAVLFETVDVNRGIRLGKPEGLERSESKGLGLRAFVGHRQAIVSTSDTSPESLAELAEHCVSMAKVTPPDADSTLAPMGLYPTSIENLDLFDKEEPTSEWLLEQCHTAEEAARSVKGISNSEGAEAHYSKSVISLAIATGKGVSFAESYPSSNFSVSVSVLAGSGTNMERDYDYTSARHRNNLTDAAAVGLSAAQRTLKRLNPRKVATCQVPIVYDPRVSKNLVGIFAGAISGSAIARGASFLKDSMGKEIFAKGVTIIDDPHIKRGLGSKPFDAEGVKNNKLLLLQNGVLKSWLLDMRTANKLKLETTGRATRGIASPPSPSSTNLYMQAGDVSVTDLLAPIKSGFYVTETFGGGVNQVTGDYSQGASGFWIENGEIAYPVSEITIAGRLQDMFKKLTPANDLALRYATNAPTVRIESMTVAGS